MRLYRTSAPTQEPLTLEEAFRHLRLDGYGESPAHPEEPLIESMISAAREQAEDYTGRAFAPGTFALRLPSIWSPVEFPISPIRSVSAVEYMDEALTWAAIPAAEYIVDTDTDHAYLWMRDTATVPTDITTEVGDPYRITFDAGYTYVGDSPDDMPLPFRAKAAVALIVAALYEHREDTIVGTTAVQIPHGAEYLLHPLRRDIL